MRKLWTFAFGVVATLLVVGLAVRAQSQTPPAPLVDRVGFPDNYQTTFVPLFAFDRPDNRQIRVVYGNHLVTNTKKGEPYQYGSVMVMETYRARTDAQNVPLRDGNGRFIRDQLTAIFVMRKERGFGREYEQNRTGEWEYVAFRPDRTYQTEPRGSWACANCHLMATATRDWVFRGNMIYDSADGKGAVPDGVLQQYSFLPSTIRVRAGTTVNWVNDDEVDHQIAVTTGQAVEGPVMSPGKSFRARFNSPGEYDVMCRIHPTMRARVTVDP
jgi:plastocyanin